MKYNRTDTIYLVKRDVNSFCITFSNEKDAEDVCIQLNQDLRDAYGEDYPKEFYVDETNLYGADDANKFRTDKELRRYLIKKQ
jgi:hypothetical protein